MQRAWSLIVVAGLGLSIAGCGSKTDATANGDSSSDTKSTPAESNVKSDGRTPQQVVQIFLEGMQSGDQAKVDSMLTNKARLSNVMNAEPRDARFKIGDVETIKDQGAHVASAWYYTDEAGNEAHDVSIWVLRKDPEGYRISGMIMRDPQAGADAEPAVFDFEDSEHMRQMEREFAAQQAAGENPASEVANKPKTREADPRR
jgi:hypothetical protein